MLKATFTFDQNMSIHVLDMKIFLQ